MHMSKGFLGTAAPMAADRALVIEIGMGIALIVGVALARRRHYRAHGWCQFIIVLLNLVLIVQFMEPSFRHQVLPAVTDDLGDIHYAIAMAHGALGTIAELFALYIVLAAGTTILPTRLRFSRYKRWMRVALVLWLITLLSGIATYVQWYGLPLRRGVTRLQHGKVPL
jgi:uncharacterized membrane protein YozB (DUF420 family)